MKLARKLAAGAAALAVTLGAAQAGQAAVIDWTLSDGTFAGGGTFSGTFSFDSASDTITDWNVTTTAGAVPFLGETYSPTGGCGPFGCDFATDNGSGPTFYSAFIFGVFSLSLTNVAMDAPGSVNALTGSEGFSSSFGGGSRSVTGGTAVGVLESSVPEPAEWSLLILGAGLAGASLRRARRPAAA